MARKIFTVVALFVVCYMAAHFYIRYKNTVTDDVSKIGRLVECQPNDARTITIWRNIEGRMEELRFERLDQPEPGLPAVTAVARWDWAMRAPSNGVADPTTMRRIASTLCELYDPVPVRAEEFHPEILTRRLARRVVVSLDGGRTATVEFGALADRSTVIRFSGIGPPRLVRITDRFLEVVSLPAGDYKNLRVMRLETDNIQSAKLTIDGKERFSLERAGADWKVLLRGKAVGDGSEEAMKFLNRISTLRGIGVEAEGFPPEKCAALKAYAVVSALGIAGRQETLRFDFGPKGDIMACSSLGAQEFRVHHDMAQFLDVPLKRVVVK